MRELVQLLVTWYMPGDETVVDDDSLYCTTDGQKLDDLSEYTKSKVETPSPPDEFTAPFDPCEIVVKPFVEITPIRYMGVASFSGIEDEVQNTSQKDVFDTSFVEILKLCNKTGCRVAPNEWGHRGTVSEVVTTVWHWSYTPDDDGGESDFHIEGAVIFTDLLLGNKILSVDEVKNLTPEIPNVRFKPLAVTLLDLKEE